MCSDYYPPYHIGGACLHVEHLAKELAKMGHEVHVLYSLDAYRVKKRSYEAKRETMDATGLVNTHTIRTPASSSAFAAYLIGSSFQVIRKFRSLVKTIAPDVVNHHNIALLGYKILERIGAYVNLYTAHDFWLICQNGVLFRDWKAICESRGGQRLAKECVGCALRCHRPPQIWRRNQKLGSAARGVDCVLVPSQYMRVRLLGSTQLDRVAVLPFFVPEPPEDATGDSAFSDFFLYAGRLEIYKGILELIDLVSKTEHRLLIVGDGPLRREVTSILKRKGLSKRIMFLGHADRVSLYRLLRDANALIIPSTCAENSPLVALEALSVGTPVIASNQGGLPEIVGKIDKDLLFGSFDQLNRTMGWFKRDKYSSNAIRGIYEKYYSPQSYVKAYGNVIDDADHHPRG